MYCRLFGAPEASWFLWPVEPQGFEWEDFTAGRRPTEPYPILRAAGEGVTALLARWGLIPHWAKDPRKFRHTSQLTREVLLKDFHLQTALKQQRCLIPVAAYLEVTGGQPRTVGSRTGHSLMIAGLCDTWQGPEGTLSSFTLIACPHSTEKRTLVLLGKYGASKWLCPNTPVTELVPLLKPCLDSWLSIMETP